MTDAEARLVVVEAWRSVHHATPTRAQAQLCQAVGWLETRYGRGWKPVGAQSHNWGAVQQGNWKGATFEYTDTRPNADGTSTPYRVGFRAYATDIEGCADMIRRITTGGIVHREAPLDLRETVSRSGKSPRAALIMPALLDADAAAFSACMYWTVYYQGHGVDHETRIRHHLTAVKSAVVRQVRSTGEPPDALERVLVGEELDALDEIPWSAAALSAQREHPGAFDGTNNT